MRKALQAEQGKADMEQKVSGSQNIQQVIFIFAKRCIVYRAEIRNIIRKNNSLLAMQEKQQSARHRWANRETFEETMPGHGGNRTYDLWNTSLTLCQMSYAVRTVRVSDISEQNLVPSIPM